ncbi:hypothetical protein [Roseovarius arcticus]|uniref:hypothetical protein n=1 Tax=Roseovarius arcticus TaxID=2547404 RepID=UPI0014868425|nr:hypothetical protein [Roseovarius arcticus]
MTTARLTLWEVRPITHVADQMAGVKGWGAHRSAALRLNTDTDMGIPRLSAPIKD